jgi:hypothetical protein
MAVEGRDWFAVVAEGGPCPDCGLDALVVARVDLGPSLLAEARSWEDELADLAADDAAVRRRPRPETWSAVEYAAHVGDVLRIFAGRVRRCRFEDRPELGWWDHEAAAVEERYNDRPIADVRSAIADGAVALALALPRLDDPDSWERSGIRRGGERFTVDGLTRFALHESVHHRLDARRSATS